MQTLSLPPTPLPRTSETEDELIDLVCPLSLRKIYHFTDNRVVSQ